MLPDFIRDGLTVLLVLMEDVVIEDNPELAFEFFEDREQLLESNTS